MANAPGDGVGVGKLEVGEVSKELFDRDAQLEPSEVRAEPAMNAETKRCVTVLFTVDEHFVGTVERERVYVGRGEWKQNPLVDLHRTSTDLDIFFHHARHRDGCVRTQQFFDGGGNEVGLGQEALAIGGRCCKVQQAGANGAPRGVDAGHTQPDDQRP